MDESGPQKFPAKPLRDALRTARIEAAERSAVIVELRDAEAARLELLNEALDPVFADVPAEHLDLFDRGISGGTQLRLWIDMVAYVVMGRDKRTYRFLQDTVHGRRVLAESLAIEMIVPAVTRYVARRMVAREQMLAGMAPAPFMPQAKLLEPVVLPEPPRRNALADRLRESGLIVPVVVSLVAGIAIGIIVVLSVLALR
ncbi:MAG: hypothetical protein IT539_04405 [Bradyrhizobiaceae bacterium]|nr:hypothetical protein [Bradyrhizobiaceae bacterium]